MLPISHDEVVHGKGSLLGKMPGDKWQRFAERAGAARVHVGAPGQAAAVHGLRVRPGRRVERTAGSTGGCSTRRHQGVQRLSRDLNAVYRQTPALWEQDTSPDGFRWIDADDAQGNVLSFLRFPAVPEEEVEEGSWVAGAVRGDRVPGQLLRGTASRLPDRPAPAGRWREILNTDATVYGGSGTGNLGAIDAMPEPWHGQPASARITLPPLGVLWLTPES